MSCTINISGAGSTASGLDHHSGFSDIAAGTTVTITASKQMVVFGDFILEGALNIEGTLILED